MPLVNLKPVLREAKAKGYAVAAFNPVDYASMKAMVKAAEELKAPVIIQASAKTIKYYSHAAIVGWMREIAADSPSPVVAERPTDGDTPFHSTPNPSVLRRSTPNPSSIIWW